MHRTGITLSLLLAGLPACGGDDGPDPEQVTPTPPTQVALVTSGADASFETPMDAVASPDGATFYFSAFTTDGAVDPNTRATIYGVPSAGGQVQTLYQGAPLQEPTGLLMSCDGETLYIADIGRSSDELDAEEEGTTEQRSTIYTLDVASNQLSTLAASGVGEAASLALSKDCSRLYVTGYTEDGAPALFQLPPAGGAATVVKSGAPLVSPSGVYVDADEVAWVMDHQPENGAGGLLFAIAEDGTTTPVIDKLLISEPAGVSLISAGKIAVIPTRDLDDNSQLLTVHTDTAEMTLIETPSLIEPAGIRTAIDAPIMALVDADGNAIYRVE